MVEDARRANGEERRTAASASRSLDERSGIGEAVAKRNRSETSMQTTVSERQRFLDFTLFHRGYGRIRLTEIAEIAEISSSAAF